MELEQFKDEHDMFIHISKCKIKIYLSSKKKFIIKIIIRSKIIK